MDSLESLLARMEELLGTLEQFDAAEREQVFELLDGIDTLHRRALVQLAGALTPEELNRLRAVGEAVSWLFDAYGVGVDQHAAAEHALDHIRPYIDSHGGRVDILDVSDGVVRLHMSGACAGCSASAMTLTDGIEKALREHVPGFVRIEAEEEPAAPHPPPGPVMVQLQLGPPEDWR